MMLRDMALGILQETTSTPLISPHFSRPPGKMSQEKSVAVLDMDQITKLFEQWQMSMNSKFGELGSQIDSKLDSKLDSKFSGLKEDLLSDLLKAWATTHYTQTPTELGGYVKEEAVLSSYLVPDVFSKALADDVWPPDIWETLVRSKVRTLEKDFIDMVKEVKVDRCENVITFTGNVVEDGHPLRRLVDFTVHIKGKPPLPCYTAALISLHSLSEPVKEDKHDRKYNAKPHVGHAVSKAITVLQDSGPWRKRIVVAVTNLRLIQWFAVERASEVEFNYKLFSYLKGCELDKVKESLVAILMANPCSLYLPTDSLLTLDSQNVVITTFLGSGLTSNVYSCEDFHGRPVAVKIYKISDTLPKASDLAEKEKSYLDLLKGVPGVPVCAGMACDKIFLLLYPVGKKLRTRGLSQIKKYWPDIVGTLQGVHSKKVVHRDVRMGNIVSVENGSLVLIDWGFACDFGCSIAFYGSLFTASKSILQQYIEDSLHVSFAPEDDLVSYVKALYLLARPLFERKLRAIKLGIAPKVAELGTSKSPLEALQILDLWEEELKEADAWCEAIKLAENLNYDGLKHWILNWALNHCPY